jgi:hypothetical protein
MVRISARLIRDGVRVPRAEAPAGEDFVPVVYAVTTQRRTWQIVHALPINLTITWRYRKWVTWVVADLNMPADDELTDFIGEYLRPPLATGHLRVFRHTDPAYTTWHASIAKNTAHRCAVRALDCSVAGRALLGVGIVGRASKRAPRVGPAPRATAQADISPSACIVNVDGDNLITEQFVIDSLRRAQQMRLPLNVAVPSGGMPKLDIITVVSYTNDAQGTTGRSMLPAPLFLALGGFDQGIGPSGYQDRDLVVRAKAVGRGERVYGSWVGAVISNVRNARGHKVRFAEHCAAKTAAISPEVMQAWGGTWATMNERNVELCRAKMRAGEIVRNVGQTIGLPVCERQYRMPGTAAAQWLDPEQLRAEPVPPAPAPRKPKLKIFTFGLLRLHGSFPHSNAAAELWTLQNRNRRGPPQPVPEELLWRAFEEAALPTPTMFMDARTPPPVRPPATPR